MPLNAPEEQHVRALRDLKVADPGALQGSFEALMEALMPIMSRWDIVRNYVRPTISKADVGLDSIAYLNLLKWRCDSPTMHMFHQSWQAHTREQYRLLRPEFVIAIGSTTGDRFEAVSNAHDTTGIKVFRLKRARSDRQRPPADAMRLMPEIAQEIREHYGDR